MQVALVEPYYGGSHQAWADGYAARSSHEVRLLTHDARFCKSERVATPSMGRHARGVA